MEVWIIWATAVGVDGMMGVWVGSSDTLLRHRFLDGWKADGIKWHFISYMTPVVTAI